MCIHTVYVFDLLSFKTTKVLDSQAHSVWFAKRMQ